MVSYIDCDDNHQHIGGMRAETHRRYQQQQQQQQVCRPGVIVSASSSSSSPSSLMENRADVEEDSVIRMKNSGGSPLCRSSITARTEEEQAAFEADKRAVYKHPLFPLLALIFERCEQATHYVPCPTASSSEAFIVDVQEFVQHQEKDQKPLLTKNEEVDNLMIKAIQVLRIHLLELEKVQELCRDFCTRYISCLKGKMQSENLLKLDSTGAKLSNFPSPPSQSSNSSSSGRSSPSPSPTSVNTKISSCFPLSSSSSDMLHYSSPTPHSLAALPLNSRHRHYLQPQPAVVNSVVRSTAKHYAEEEEEEEEQQKMTEINIKEEDEEFNRGTASVTPVPLWCTQQSHHHIVPPFSSAIPGHVAVYNTAPFSSPTLAFRHNIAEAEEEENDGEEENSNIACSSGIPQGIASSSMPQRFFSDGDNIAAAMATASSSIMSTSDIASKVAPLSTTHISWRKNRQQGEPSTKRKKRNGISAKRGVLPKKATAIMRSWLFKHLMHPYPSEEEKKQIALETNLTLLQVNNWFINARRRILQPMLDASAPSSSSTSSKVNVVDFDDDDLGDDSQPVGTSTSMKVSNSDDDDDEEEEMEEEED